jgi:acetamidase/formamidase
MLTQLLGVILSLLELAGLQGQSVQPADLAGDWILTVDDYSQTRHRRMTVRAVRDQVTVAAWGLEFKGTVRDGTMELKPTGREQRSARMTGSVEQGRMSGETTFDAQKWHWSATRLPVRPPNAPREHAFEPKEFHRVFSGAIQPVLHIYPGDVVKTWSVDAGGVDAKGVTRSLGGNPLTGPFYIEGALPGDTLVVKLNRIRLNRDTAISTASIAMHAVMPYYAATRRQTGGDTSQWILDRQKGVARLAKPSAALKDYIVPLRPFLGCVGVAPPEHMIFRSSYPGSFGGNMDYNRLLEGTTLYLPVDQLGALLFVGDGHAAQGDGELTGNALETSMDIEFGVDVIPGKRIEMPRAEDTEFLMAMGIAGSLTEALQIATTEMAQWLEDTYKLKAADVASLLGTAMRYDIAEVVDPNVNVVARVPKKLLAPISKAHR